MTKVFWWMVLSCAWFSAFGIREPQAAVSLVSAPEQPLLSVSAAGSSTVAQLSSTGRFVLFASTAGDLVTNTPNEFTQVFLRDRQSGTTVLVSATPEGAAANGSSFGFFVDDAGQKVVFQSGASDLGPEDENEGDDLYMRDLVTGATTLLSASTNGAAGDGESRYPITTPDGLFVAFESAAGDLVENDTNRAVDVFVRDIRTGMITLASRIPSGFSSSVAAVYELSGLSADGQYVLFTAAIAKPSTPSVVSRQVFLRDTLTQTTRWISSNAPPVAGGVYKAMDCSKAFMTPDAKHLLFVTQRQSKPSSSPNEAITCHYELLTGITTIIATNPVEVALDSSGALDPVISSDGRFAAYTIRAGGSRADDQVYRLDLVTGSNVLVSVSTNGVTPGNGTSDSPQISSSGRVMLFQTRASDIVTEGLTNGWNAVLRDMDTGTSRLARTNPDGTPVPDDAFGGVLATPDLRLIAFDSGSDSIVPGDANNDTDVFVRDLDSAGVELISVGDVRAVSATVSGVHSSFVPGISSDGRFVVFGSASKLLSARDTNQYYDAYIRDTALGTTRLLTLNAAGTGAQNGGLAASPSVSDDGRFVVFSSGANDLNAADTNRAADVYIRDLVDNTNILASKNLDGVGGGGISTSAPLIAPAGEFVLYASAAPNMVPGVSNGGKQWIYRYDLRSGTNVNIPYASASLASYHCGLLSTSRDRQRMVIGFSTGSTLTALGVYDMQSGAYRFHTNAAATYASLSGDGQRLAFARRQEGGLGVELVYVDLSSDTNQSVIPLEGTTVNAISLSQDGTRVAFEALPASYSQVYVWDAATGSNSLVSVNMAGQPAQGRCKLVGITPDGNRVVFNSQAEDLVTTDHNGMTDVYVRDLGANRTWLLSEERHRKGSGNGLSVATALSADGTSVVFDSTASDLIERDLNGQTDVFVARIEEPVGDLDADGLPDDWEWLYFKDLSHSPDEDADWDGASNMAEWEAGTSPNDSRSVLGMSGLTRRDDNGFRVSWAAVAGKTYRVQYKDDLGEEAWKDLAGDVTATGAAAEKDVPSLDQDSRYYRVILVR